MCKKQCLWVGLTCIILEIAFKTATVVSKKHCLWVGLTCPILEIPIKRATDVSKNNASG